MAKETQKSEERKVRSDAATSRHRADLSLIISILALLASGLTAWTARDALSFNKQAQADAQKTAIFAQFQQQYLAVSGQFPP